MRMTMLRCKYIYTLILLLACISLPAENQDMSIPEIHAGFAYSIVDFTISGELEGLQMFSSDKPTESYYSPYLDCRSMHALSPHAGFGIKTGFQGWKADYMLNVQDTVNYVSWVPFESYISNYNMDLGLIAYEKYGRLTCTQSLSVMLAVLTYAIENYGTIYNDMVTTAGFSAELGLQLRVTKTGYLDFAIQQQGMAKDKYQFEPDKGLELTGKFPSPVTVYKIGISLDSEGVEDLWNRIMNF